MFLLGRGRPAEAVALDDELEIRDARFDEKASEVEDEISLCFVFEVFLMPYNV